MAKELIVGFINVTFRNGGEDMGYVVNFLSESGRHILSTMSDSREEASATDWASEYKEDFDECFPDGWYFRYITLPRNSLLVKKAVAAFKESEQYKSRPSMKDLAEASESSIAAEGEPSEEVPVDTVEEVK